LYQIRRCTFLQDAVFPSQIPVTDHARPHFSRGHAASSDEFSSADGARGTETKIAAAWAASRSLLASWGGIRHFGTVNRADFENSFRKLLADATSQKANTGCYACDRCEGCQDCTFCVGSKNCSRCTYCRDCDDTRDSSHCIRAKQCLQCQHCVDCERCVRSAYLTKSIGCSDCTYCFGCVGLAKKDFHILNVPYPRDEWFKIVKQLEKELRIDRTPASASA
jgi:hypothetical protein